MAQRKLNPRQLAFIHYYIQSYNATDAYFRAYNCSRHTAQVNSLKLLSKTVILEEIERAKKEQFQKNVASSEEVMDFFSRVMRGEVKDQFGLETSVADRIKAAQELAKRTIDIENRKLGLGDNTIEIKLDWNRPALEIGAGGMDAEFTVID